MIAREGQTSCTWEVTTVKSKDMQLCRIASGSSDSRMHGDPGATSVAATTTSSGDSPFGEAGRLTDVTCTRSR